MLFSDPYSTGNRGREVEYMLKYNFCADAQSIVYKSTKRPSVGAAPDDNEASAPAESFPQADTASPRTDSTNFQDPSQTVVKVCRQSMICFKRLSYDIVYTTQRHLWDGAWDHCIILTFTLELYLIPLMGRKQVWGFNCYLLPWLWWKASDAMDFLSTGIQVVRSHEYAHCCPYITACRPGHTLLAFALHIMTITWPTSLRLQSI